LANLGLLSIISQFLTPLKKSKDHKKLKTNLKI